MVESSVNSRLEMEVITNHMIKFSQDDAYNRVDAAPGFLDHHCNNYIHTCGTCTTAEIFLSGTHYRNTHNLADIQHKQFCDKKEYI